LSDEIRAPSRASTAFILITLLLDTLGVGLIIPVGPRLVAKLLGDVANVGAAAPYVGALFAMYSVMQFFCAPILGGLSDRFGRRAVILPSLAGAAASYLFSALAPELWWLFVGRTIAGMTGASFSAATAYIADVTPPAKRAQSFGLVGAAFGLGFIVGPVLGGVLGKDDPSRPYLVAAGLNFLNFLYGSLVLPESLPRDARRPFTFARANPFAAFRNLGRHPIVLGLTGTMAFGYLAQMIFQSVWSVSYPVRFNWDAADVGFSLGVVGVAAALVQGGLIRALVPRFGEKRLLIFALATNVASLVGFGLARTPWLVYVTIFPFALGGLSGPSIQSLLTREVGPTEQGELQGSLTSLSSVAAIIGPPLGTQLVFWFERPDAPHRLIGVPFFAAACCNLIGLLLALRLFARLRAETRAPDEKPDPAV
jgi:DHA1 family tetracycline resistance protein-like MFS transporter